MLYYEHSFLAVCASMGNQDVDGLLKQLIQKAIAQGNAELVMFLAFDRALQGGFHKIASLLMQDYLAQALGSSGRAAAVDGILALAEHLPGILTKERLDAGLRRYYDEALKPTAKSLYRTIQRFPQTYNLDLAEAESELVRKKFVNWYNLILKRDCIDLWRGRRNRPKPVELDRPIGEDGDLVGDIIADPNNPSPLEKAIQEENKRFWLEKCLPELENCASEEYPACNCGELYRRRIGTEPPEKWKDIAKALGVEQGTITAHWHRRCKPLLRRIAEGFRDKVED